MESEKNKQSFKFISYTKLKLPLSLSFANKMDCFLIKCFYHYFTKYRQMISRGRVQCWPC